MSIRDYKHFIGGRYVDGVGGDSIERVSPANGQTVAANERHAPRQTLLIHSGPRTPIFGS